MNVCTLIGRLTSDPDLKYTSGQNQIAIATFTLAVDRMVKAGQQKQADFIRIKVFGKTAENCDRFLSKGSKCGVIGSIQTGDYEKEGRKIYYTEVVARNVEFLDSRGERNDSLENVQPPQLPDSGFQEISDEDIPW
jgi:single-strand DNA-binding protein